MVEVYYCSLWVSDLTCCVKPPADAGGSDKSFMSIKIVHDNYGKSRVRLMKVERRGAFHEIQNITVKISLEGDFEEIHTVGDNSKCLPTDTMKNTVYALASQTQEIEEIETFAMRLTKHFLTNNPQIERVIIEIDEHGWTRMNFSGRTARTFFHQRHGRKTHRKDQRES